MGQVLQFKRPEKIGEWNTDIYAGIQEAKISPVDVLHKDGRVFRASWGKLKDWYVWDWLIDDFPHGTWDKIVAWRTVK